MNSKLGKINAADFEERDAIHVPIAAVEAGELLRPGQWVKFSEERYRDLTVYAATAETAIGVVDPFLPRPAKKEEVFFILVKPGVVDNLHHSWDANEFPDQGERDAADSCRGCY